MKIVGRSKFMAVLHQLGRLLPKDNGTGDPDSAILGFWMYFCVGLLKVWLWVDLIGV